MAETDGTPRYRKSKPPNGKGGGRSSRNTRPNGKARKRAELNSTLPNGAPLDQADQLNQVDKVESEPAQAGGKPAQATAEKSETHVVKTIPTIIRTEPVAAEPVVEPVPDALADTHTSGDSLAPRSKPQRGPNPAMLRSKRPLLASTLRMELTVRRNEGAEPEFSVRPTPSYTDGFDARDNDRIFVDENDGLSTLPENAPRSRKPTAPGGYSSTFEDIPVRSRERAAAAHGGTAEHESQRFLEETVRRGSDISSDTMPTMQTQRPRRPRRPGERTLIMTRRDTKQSSKRDWLFVVMLVAALGLTASMFLSRQTPSEADEVADAELDEPQDEQQPDTFATTLQPYKARPERTDKPAATESSISASTIQATELRSLPSGAEVMAGDAVVGSTPVRVARGSAEMTYTLRMPGHQPKVVRVGPQSPPSIMVELTRIVSGSAAPSGLGAAAATGLGTGLGGIQPSEPPADVPPAAAK